MESNKKRHDQSVEQNLIQEITRSISETIRTIYFQNRWPRYTYGTEDIDSVARFVDRIHPCDVLELMLATQIKALFLHLIVVICKSDMNNFSMCEQLVDLLKKNTLLLHQYRSQHRKTTQALS
jgi:hypothetical protein